LVLPADLPRVSVKRIVYRVIRQGFDPLGIEGSMKAGGRFNSSGEFGALYTSLEAATAAKEVARGLRLRGVDPAQFPAESWWIYELEVRIEAVLDLTDTDILQRIGVTKDSLTGSAVDAARRIAAEARRQGYEALLVPSAAAPEFNNLVIFVDKLAQEPIVLSSRPMQLA
jgi:RES domain-containing protein